MKIINDRLVKLNLHHQITNIEFEYYYIDIENIKRHYYNYKKI